MLVQLRDCNADVPVRRIFPLKLARNRQHLCPGLRERDTRLQPGKHVEIVIDSWRQFIGCETGRHPQYGVLVRILKIRRHDTNHGICESVQVNRAANYAGIAAKP